MHEKMISAVITLHIKYETKRELREATNDLCDRLRYKCRSLMDLHWPHIGKVEVFIVDDKNGE